MKLMGCGVPGVKWLEDSFRDWCWCCCSCCSCYCLCRDMNERAVNMWALTVGVKEAVYNMLITTLFLLFVLTTVALLIFLLMRRPPCCPCCQDPYDTSASPGSTGSQAANITYLTETHGIVVKKWMKDSPPPYESPPEYSSLSPELIMDAKTLQDLVTSPPPPPPPPQSSAPASSSPPAAGVVLDRSSSPLCTTPLFSASFCDSPRSLTPTIHHEGRGAAAAAACLFDRSSSPIFTHYQSPPAGGLSHPSSSSSSSSTTYVASSAVAPSVYGQATPSPPSYESLQQVYCHDAAPRRKEDAR
ncbi:hypothetical protein O3P69_015443 [Scylla paramamosain]|uniref:Protein tweety homolog n=1 Tax=Scylla paramamosain TaxID=85552 RepID=A0AAW0T4V6_SCYPA